jgi:hypothetical protein
MIEVEATEFIPIAPLTNMHSVTYVITTRHVEA